ncbi:MAG: exodeoxyribonuclease Xth [Chloroflexi bacterium]|nr:exodeoxyribonuclease Xth [Chloroflexota bacterium]
MKIATWNVNGIRARQAQFLAWLDDEQPDAICLQELKAAPPQIAQTLLELPGYVGRWHCAGPYSGVSLLLREDTFGSEPVFGHPSFDRDTRVVQAGGSDLTIASVYVPNGGKDYQDKLRFLGQMTEWVADTLASGTQLVLCGDMNVTRGEIDVHVRERNTKLVGQREDERQLFERLLATGLTDVTRTLYPDDDEFFTWWAPWRNHRDRNVGWRIDYVLAAESLAKRAVDCVVRRAVGTSDHGPVVAIFD